MATARKKGRPKGSGAKPKEVPTPPGLKVVKTIEHPYLQHAQIIRTSDGRVGILTDPLESEPISYSPRNVILAASKQYGAGVEMLYKKDPKDPKEPEHTIGFGFVLGRLPETKDEMQAVLARKKESEIKKAQKKNLRNHQVRLALDKELEEKEQPKPPAEEKLIL